MPTDTAGAQVSLANIGRTTVKWYHVKAVADNPNADSRMGQKPHVQRPVAVCTTSNAPAFKDPNLKLLQSALAKTKVHGILLESAKK